MRSAPSVEGGGVVELQGQGHGQTHFGGVDACGVEPLHVAASVARHGAAEGAPGAETVDDPGQLLACELLEVFFLNEMRAIPDGYFYRAVALVDCYVQSHFGAVVFGLLRKITKSYKIIAYRFL